MENIEEYEKFVDLTINKINNYLEILGYTDQGYELFKDSLNIERVKILYSNIIIDKSISFEYSQNNYGGIYRDHVSVFIENAKRSYMLEDILEYEKIHYNKYQFFLLNYTGNFKQKVNGICDYLLGLMVNPIIKKWITGEKWADIPFDWGGYK